MENSSNSQMFDGPFKVPLPRKTPRDLSNSDARRKINVPTPQYKKVNVDFQSLIFQKLLVKMLQSPSTLSKHEMKILSTHPIINSLLKAAKSKEYSNASFYISIDSLFNPELWGSEILFEKTQSNPDEFLPTDSLKADQKSDDDLSEESTSSHHDCEEPKVGIYTMAQRKLKIAKYKSKQSRHFSKIQQNGLHHKRQRKLAEKQSISKARFSKYTSEDDDFMSLIETDYNMGLNESNKHLFNSCSGEFRQSEISEEPQKTLNDVVAELTGIF